MPDSATVRSVTVRLDADVAAYIAKMEAAGRATDKAFGGTSGMKSLDGDLRNVGRSADSTGTSIDRLGTSLRRTEQDAARTDNAFKRNTTSIDKYSGRLGLLVTSITALGPALIPITAAAVPAIAGLTAGMGALAAGVGVGLLAFHGLGDALKALDAYQLNPTTQNLQKLQQTMQGLSPAARGFVRELDQMEGPLKQLQAAAASGFLPGAGRGLQELMHLFPQVKGFVTSIADEMGRLSIEGSHSLVHDPAWQAFFAMIRRDGVPVMDAWARATGNVAKGLASLLVDFSGEIGRFDSGLVNSSRHFATWAAGLGKTQGFQDFLDYIHRMGPEVGQFISALAQALVAVVKAAAPWGSTVLPILTSVLSILSAIANSKAGPVLFDLAAGMLLLSKATALMKGNSAISSISTDVEGLGAAAKTTMADISAMRGEIGLLQATSMSLRTSGALGKVGKAVGPVAKNLLGTAGIIGLGDVIGGSHSTGRNVGEGALSGAAIGTMIDPGVGTAIGAAAGAAVGLGKSLLASDKATKTQLADWSNLASTINADTGRITASTKQQVADTLRTSGALATGQQFGLGPQQLGSAVLGGPQAYTQVIDQIKAKIAQLQSYTKGSGGLFDQSGIDANIKSLQDLEANLENGRAAIKNSAAAWRQDQAVIASTTESLHQYVAAQQAATAAALTSFGAEVSYRQALKAAQAQARTNNAGIKGMSNAAIQNSSALNQLASAWQQQTQASRVTVAQFQRAKSQFIQTAEAMGVPRAAAKALANQLIQIPKKVLTQVYLDDGGVAPRIAAIRAELATLHDKTVTVAVRQVSAGSHIHAPGPGIGTGSDGTTVPKDGLPYADRHLYLLAPGEEVISNRHGQADFYRTHIKGQIPGLADGGTSGGPRHPGGGPYASIRQDTAHRGEIRKLVKALDDLTNKQFKRLGAAVDDLSIKRLQRLDTAIGKVESAALSAYDSAKQKRAGYESSITSGLMPDLFASTNSSGNVFSRTNASGLPTPGAVNATLRTTRANAAEFVRLVKALKAKGLSGPALAQIIGSGDIALAREYAALPASALHQYGSLYSAASHAVAQAAAVGGNALVPQVGQLHTDLVAVQQGLKDIQHTISKKEAADHKSRIEAAKHAGDHARAPIKAQAAKGARDRRP